MAIVMTKLALVITPTTLYAAKLGFDNKYWRVVWNKETFATCIADVIATLGSTSFHVIITGNLPQLTTNHTTDQLAEYHVSLLNLGCSPLSIKQVSEVEELSIITNLKSFLPPTPPTLTVGSLEDIGQKEAKNSSIIQSLLITLTAILLAGGVWFLYSDQLLSRSSSPSPTPNPTPPILISPSPSPSPTIPTPNNQNYKIKIQNGSGIAGIASKLSARLEKEGFSIDSIGNADSYNYQSSKLFLKSQVPSSIEAQIKSILIDSSWEKDSLEDSSPFDILIIIGRKSTLSD